MTEICIAFAAGVGFTFACVGIAVWALDKIDGWWGHRVYRGLEDRKSRPSPEDAISDKEVGFRA